MEADVGKEQQDVDIAECASACFDRERRISPPADQPFGRAGRERHALRGARNTNLGALGCARTRLRSMNLLGRRVRGFRRLQQHTDGYAAGVALRASPRARTLADLWRTALGT